MAEISRALKVKKSSNVQAKAGELKLQNVQNSKPPLPTSQKVLKKGGNVYTAVGDTAVAPRQLKPVSKRPVTKGSAKGRRSKSADHTVSQTQITDFFQRRSSRKLEAQSKADQQMAMEKRIIEGVEDGLKVEVFGDKGRGVVATKRFQRGEYVVEYFGELISLSEAKKREEDYSTDLAVGCYMLYFQFKSRRLCVDATAESGRLGRLVNHKKHGNCVTKSVLFPQDCAQKKSGRTSPEERPRVLLVATRDIEIGEEILYDYGDRSPDSIASHPWLAK